MNKLELNSEKAIWYSFSGKEFDTGAPYFLEAKEFDWALMLEKNATTILTELQQFLNAAQTKPKPYFNNSMVDSKNTWSVNEFYFWGKKYSAACELVPQLDKLMQTIPGFLSAGISTLAANTDIKPHFGDTNAIIRAHIGITIPADYPTCGIQVGDEEKGWQEGKILLFCDANKHRAWNHSNSNRYVLIIDVLRAEYLSKKNMIISNVLSNMALQKLELRFPFVKALPGPIRGMIRIALKKRMSN